MCIRDSSTEAALAGHVAGVVRDGGRAHEILASRPDGQNRGPIRRAAAVAAAGELEPAAVGSLVRHLAPDQLLGFPCALAPEPFGIVEGHLVVHHAHPYAPLGFAEDDARVEAGGLCLLYTSRCV